MKICPTCAFANAERFPACLWCNTVLVDVRSTPSDNPNDPEHLQRVLADERRGIARRQLGFAAAVYALTITLLAVCSGLVFNPGLLLLYSGTSLAVALTVLRGWTGPFSASFLQGGVGVVLVLHGGSLHPFIFFMLLGHVTLPAVFCHWTEMIHDAQR